MTHDLIGTRAYDEPGEHVIRPDLYLPTEIGPIKIAEVRFEAVHSHETQVFTVDGDDVAKAVIEDVLKNTKQYLRVDGTISDT